MKSLNERINDIVVIKNVSKFAPTINTKEKPKGMLVEANSKTTISVGDLISILRNNVYVYGVDGLGTNAILYVEDGDIRRLLRFDEYESMKKTTKVIEAEKKKAPEGTIISDTFEKCIRTQVVLSEKEFIKGVTSNNDGDVKKYCENLSGITNGEKMMVYRFMEDNKVGKLENLTQAKVALIEQSLR